MTRKRHSKHVSDRNRFSIIQPDMSKCFICGGIASEKHEIFNGGGFRQRSKDWGMVIGLCSTCHRNVTENIEPRLRIKQMGQIFFEAKYGHAKYMEVFKKNYLDEETWNELQRDGMASE